MNPRDVLAVIKDMLNEAESDPDDAMTARFIMESIREFLAAIPREADDADHD